MADQPFSLLRNLAKSEGSPQRSDGKMAFVDALQSMGIESVFDILRRAKPAFIRELSSFSDADGELAYENARCYATQIVRLYRNQLISSGRKQVLTRRTGIRSLVEIGPSFPNLFDENWDTMCKPGSIEAKDSPVAYLTSLYRFAKEQLEGSTTEPDRIALDLRRPDLKNLLIDQQSTFTPIPTLQIVNEVLSASIRDYVDTEGNPDKGKSIYQLIAEKQHPFQFPYNFHHQQIMLGLSGKKPVIGELSYRVSLETPASVPGGNAYGKIQRTGNVAQVMMSGLSPQQWLIMTEAGPKPAHADEFYVELSPSEAWSSPDLKELAPRHNTFFVPEQPDILGVTPHAEMPAGTVVHGRNELTINFKNNEAEYTTKVWVHQLFDTSSPIQQYVINSQLEAVHEKREIVLTLINGLPDDGKWYQSTFLIKQLNVNNSLVRTLSLKLFSCGTTRPVTPPPISEYDPELVNAFFKQKYDINHYEFSTEQLSQLDFFTLKTQTNATTVEALLAVSSQAPTNAIRQSQQTQNTTQVDYGACYVNGLKKQPRMAIKKNNKNLPHISDTSIERYDRLQRMIRLQRWLDIPFAELDTLIMAAIHSEGQDNPEAVLNDNTLRALGTYRYLSKRYTLEPEEFAAFIHHLSEYASGGRLPMFDRVFNNPVLFDTPLVLDNGTFFLTSDDPAHVKTIAQLCAGLQIPADKDSFWPLALDTREFIGGDLKRNLTIVSSIYRQARIASLFGLAAKDSRALIDLLGGEAWRRKVALGTLTPHPAEAASATDSEPDILDILMQLDWAVTWLKETGRDVTTLRRQLGIDPYESEATPDLLDQLNQLAKEAREAALTEAQLGNLNLPDDSAGNPIAWWSGVLAPLIDLNGLVKAPALKLIDDVGADLQQSINQQLEAVALSDELKAQASGKLLEWVLKGYLTQHRLVEGLLQSIAGLPLNRCEGVLRWAGSSADQFLGEVLAATADAELALPLSLEAKTVTDTVSKLARHAEVSQQLGLSAQALRTFLVNPQWLHTILAAPLKLSLTSLYLLDRYGQWRDRSGQPEDLLLGYFRTANITSPPAAQNLLCAKLLAKLTGWTETEIETASQAFVIAPKLARSMQRVDWIRRMHSTSQQTGLSAKSILQATDLTHDSPAAQWQAVGEAVIAASH